MQFVLTGFTPNAGFRIFAFQGIAEDRKRTEFTVTADLSLIRIYGIMTQELPLLCRELLERSVLSRPEDRALALTEADMRLHADHLAAGRAEADRKKSLRKTPARRPTETQVVMGMSREMSATNQRTQ
jgi:hypothetical protein